MSLLASLKVMRLLLAFSVSVWLAGGCMFGCSNSAMAAPNAVKEAPAVAGESCHAARSHDCCAKQKAHHKRTTTTIPVQKEALPKLTEALSSLPRGSMNECPLAINATAVTAKSNSNSPAPAYASNAALPLPESEGVARQKHVVAPLVPNRGPTYLRCCVFLI